MIKIIFKGAMLMKRLLCVFMVIAIFLGTMICAFAKVELITPTRWTTIVSVKNDEEEKTLTVTKRESGQNVPYVYENQFIRRESPPQYLFQYTNGSTTYTYTLLDKDEDGNYFIFCADRYGKVTLKNLRVNNVFDPDPASTDPNFAGDLNIAVWLNNDFLKGYTGSEPDATGTIVTDNSYDKLDTVIQDYIVFHDWEVEGNNQGKKDQYHLTPSSKTDYKVHCKIALPSISEYINYYDKIGYSSVQYLKKGNFNANSMVMFRTPFYNGATPFYYFLEQNGNTSQCTTTIDANSSYAQYYFRPCFYVSRDYFKNVRIENPGEEVVKMLLEDFTYEELLNVYTPEELAAWTGIRLKGTSIVGKPSVGQMLTAYCDYEAGTAKNVSFEYKWYWSEQADGEFHRIDDASDQHYVVEKQYENKYIKLRCKIYNSETNESYGIFEKVKYISSPESVVVVPRFNGSSADFVITNNTGERRMLTLILAAYDSNNAMVAFKAVNEAAENKTVNVVLDEAPEGAAFYRLMAWESFASPLPLCSLTVTQ